MKWVHDTWVRDGKTTELRIPVRFTVRALYEIAEETGMTTFDVMRGCVRGELSENQYMKLYWACIKAGQEKTRVEAFSEFDEFLEWALEQNLSAIFKFADDVSEMDDADIDKIEETIDVAKYQDNKPLFVMGQYVGQELAEYYKRVNQNHQKKTAKPQPQGFIPDHD